MRNLLAFVLFAFVVASMAYAKSIKSESGSNSVSDESYSIESGSESDEGWKTKEKGKGNKGGKSSGSK